MRFHSSVVLSLATLQQCVSSQSTQWSTSPPTVAAAHNNPWQALSEDETAGVNDLLMQTMNLTGNSGSSHDSYVYRTLLLRPNKSDIVPYLDSNGTEPCRYARATVVFGADDLYWQEYMVGPLPATNATEVKPLTAPFNNQQPGKTFVHPVYSAEDGAVFQANFGTEIEDITTKLWNTTFASGLIGMRIGTPFWEEDGRIISWATVLKIPDTEISSPTILPLGLFVKFDLTGRDVEDWKATGYYSLGKFYNSTDEFRAAVFSTSYVMPVASQDGNWTSTDRNGDALPLDDLPPPTSVAQGSPRFKLDTSEDYVSWMDFSFYYGVSEEIGLSLYDIQYKGKRLMYELSLQDAITHYAGSDPFASETTFFDTETGMGASMVPLIRGYDCPSHATYLNATFSNGNTTMTHVDSICIFEYDAGFPIRRHTVYNAYTSVAKNIVFTIRTVATVANYDFLIEYSFFYDGAIEVSARASGYISAAYWEGAEEYGFHIHDVLSGALHDHVMTFKADLDVLGTQNSVQKVQLMPVSAEYPWAPGQVYNTMKAVRSFVSNESVASINWGENDDAMYAIVNKDTPNRFGESPGYRFKRSAGTTHLTIKNSTNDKRASAFTDYDFFVTVQKDTEPRAADAYDQFATSDPLVDFSKFLDGESIEQEDIVLWFNLGMHHMPHTGDLPNTMLTSMHSAMRFEPLNYLEGDPSVQINQQVRVDYNDDGSVKDVEEFGKMMGTGMCTANSSTMYNMMMK